MWFATYDGINKYDGYAFTVYQHNEDDPHSIANDIARIVKTDSRGRVWIGTREGLSWYDEEKDQFKNYFYEKNGKRLQVNGIAEISPTQLLISTPEQLALFDIDKEVFIDDFFGMPTHRIVASALHQPKSHGERRSDCKYKEDSSHFATIAHPAVDCHRRSRAAAV